MADRNPGAFTALPIANLVDGDYLLLWDASAQESVRMAAGDVIDRMLMTNSIAWMNTMAAITDIALADDYVFIWNADQNRIERMTAEQFIGRVLRRANVASLSQLNLISQLAAGDQFILWDASASQMVGLNAVNVSTALVRTTPYVITTTPVTYVADHRNVVITNSGATQIITYNLPDISADYLGSIRLQFARAANYAMRLVPFSATQYVGEGGGGKYLELRSNNCQINLSNYHANNWTVTSACGSYGYEA